MITRARVLAVLAFAACGAPSSSRPEPTHWWQSAQLPKPAAPATPAAPPADDALAAAAPKIIAAALADDGAWTKLAYLTDRIGHRLSGSPALERAVTWAHDAMASDGHEVRREPVMVPHWQRGAESARLVAPIQRDLVILGLGGTPATPPRGITAPVVVVRSWEELAAKRDAVKGAIVLFDVAMAPWSEEKGTGYGELAGYRWAGAHEAAKHGAVAILIRSLTARSLRTPHTGVMSYSKKSTPLPAAAVTVEDSMLIARLAEAGPVTVNLVLSGKMLPDAPSANVIGELRGRELPDEIVLIGAHLDSWDVGQGAHDDGAGCVSVMQALTVLRKLGLTPRRTIRVVLFTNEENGLRGARDYLEKHQAEVGKHVFALETDSGAFAPRGFDLEASGDAARFERIRRRVAAIAAHLAPVGAVKVEKGHSGADVEGLVEAGVPGLGLSVDPSRYFDYHHTDADTLDKVDPGDLKANVAAIAVMAWAVAEMDGRLDD